ncbi:hypothetical protein BHE74_00021169 [Ensete ventricosum]|nr:hypothetical protein BHE74_00021169 [Ensete ventricosum]
MSILQVDVPSYFVGLLLEDCQLPLPNHAHFILADPSIVLFYSISSTEIRCFVDVPGQKVPSIVNGEMENYLKTIVAPQVPTELLDAFVAAIDKGNIRTMPCKSMPADAHRTPGVLLMGDAFNMRHPISGGGMTVGLSDVIVLRNLLRPLHDLHDAAAVCKYLESFCILRKVRQKYAFYKLFGASPDEARKEIGQAYFDCLSLGGGFSSDSTAFIGGLTASPLHLVIHFLVVVTYGVGHLLLPIPSVQRLRRSARLISFLPSSPYFGTCVMSMAYSCAAIVVLPYRCYRRSHLPPTKLHPHLPPSTHVAAIAIVVAFLSTHTLCPLPQPSSVTSL